MSLVSSAPAFVARNSRSGYTINQSLRFAGGSSDYFSRTVSGLTTQGGISFWIKFHRNFPTVFGEDPIFAINAGFSFARNYNALWYYRPNSGGGGDTTWDGRNARDEIAWYHVFLKFNSASSTSLYLNGVLVDTQAYSITTSGGTFWIGRDNGGSYYAQYYLAEFHAAFGESLDATDFGEFDDNGVWRPIKFTGSYGSDGFYLKFDPSAANGLGHDHSGNGNNFTSGGGFTTSGTGTDVMSDTPTTNWCTLNPLSPSQSEAALSNGNIDCTWSGVSGHSRRSTIAMGSGKWYAEITRGTSTLSVGLVDADIKLLSWPGNSTYGSTGSYAYRTDNGNKYNNGSASSYGNTIATGDVIGIAYDGDNGALYFSKNGTWQNSGDPTSGASATGAAFTGLGNQTWTIACGNAGGSTGGTATNFNFGQRAFAYTPPTGFKALNTSNLPAPGIKDGSKYFDAVRYSGATSGTAGAGTTQSVTGLGFSPDFVWIKNRTNANSHGLFDQVRGAVNVLRSDLTNAEATTNSSGALSAFDSNGFTLANGSSGSDQAILTHQTGYNYIAWAWDAGGSGSSNTDGSITSTVSANATAGFSIVSYTGTGANATVGHGLGVAPKMIIVKDRDAAVVWAVHHSGISINNYLRLNTTDSEVAGNAVWNQTAPTSTVFSIGTSTIINNTNDYIAYCFAEVEGYSKFGSYTGNGSTDGPFVATSFTPAFLIWKRTDSTANWFMVDAARSPYNPVDKEFYPDQPNAENTFTDVDFLSNGFKLRASAADRNANGGTFIYMCFASNPFGGFRTTPATAR